jgi:hypothetical protein
MIGSAPSGDTGLREVCRDILKVGHCSQKGPTSLDSGDALFPSRGTFQRKRSNCERNKKAFSSSCELNVDSQVPQYVVVDDGKAVCVIDVADDLRCS